MMQMREGRRARKRQYALNNIADDAWRKALECYDT